MTPTDAGQDTYRAKLKLATKLELLHILMFRTVVEGLKTFHESTRVARRTLSMLVSCCIRMVVDHGCHRCLLLRFLCLFLFFPGKTRSIGIDRAGEGTTLTPMARTLKKKKM